MNDFYVKFRGVRGSYPSPKMNYLHFGGNTACVEVRCGKQLIILDAGTGIIDIGNDQIQNSIIAPVKKNHNVTIFLSHIHQDHIQGLQFYKPLFAKTSTVNLFGMSAREEDLRDILKTILFDKVFPLCLDEIRSSFNISNFSQDNTIVISQDGQVQKYESDTDKINLKDLDIKVTSHKTMAHPKDGCLCIKIEYRGRKLVYATDKESYIGADKKFIMFSHDCDCLIHDAQYTYQDYANPIQSRQGYGHSTFEMAIETAKEAKAKKLFFFHYDPEYDDSKLLSLEDRYFVQDKIMFAKENLEFPLI